MNTASASPASCSVLDVDPAIEAARLEAVRRYDILDTPPDGSFDRLASLAAQVFGVPMGIVSIVDEDRIWFKAHHGLEVEQIDRDPGLCASVILQDDTWVVSDASVDSRALANPLVAGEFGLRFYAGHPLLTHDGHNLGTLCVLDTAPHDVTAKQTEMLQELAALVVEQLELRLSARRAVGSAEMRLQDAEHLADALQRSLLPPALPKIPHVELAATYNPASRFEVGGDFYDMFPVDDRSWGLVIGDVMGKGPTAASRTSCARYSLRAAAIRQPSPAEALQFVNQALIHDAPTAHDAPFVTALFARLVPRSGGVDVVFASAGHPNPVVLRANGSVESVGGSGTLLGVFDELDLRDATIRLSAGDTMIVYTDGVLDSGAPERLEYEGLVRLLGGCRGASPDVIVDRIRDAIERFQRDDIALVAMRCATG